MMIIMRRIAMIGVLYSSVRTVMMPINVKIRKEPNEYSFFLPNTYYQSKKNFTIITETKPPLLIKRNHNLYYCNGFCFQDSQDLDKFGKNYI